MSCGPAFGPRSRALRNFGAARSEVSNSSSFPVSYWSTIMRRPDGDRVPIEAGGGRALRPSVHQIQARVELEDPPRRAAGLRSHSRHQEAAAGEGVEIVDDTGAGGARRLDQLRIIGLGHVE